jgi:hypothetical protein
MFLAKVHESNIVFMAATLFKLFLWHRLRHASPGIHQHYVLSRNPYLLKFFQQEQLGHQRHRQAQFPNAFLALGYKRGYLGQQQTQ